MNTFQGKTLSWSQEDGAIHLVLDRAPCNEIGSLTLPELELFVNALPKLQQDAHSLIISSARQEGFCAGADLRELYRESQPLAADERASRLHDFLERIHKVMNTLDAAPLTTIAAVEGIAFGGGFELALTCDLIIADKMARFCFPELRLGLIPGFGGIPRLKRDLGNAVVRDLLLTGRSINATKAQSVGLVSQVVAEGRSAARRALHCRAAGEIRSRNCDCRKEFHQADPPRRTATGDRYFLRAFCAPGGAGGLAEIR